MCRGRKKPIKLGKIEISSSFFLMSLSSIIRRDISSFFISREVMAVGISECKMSLNGSFLDFTTSQYILDFNFTALHFYKSYKAYDEDDGREEDAILAPHGNKHPLQSSCE